MTSRPLLEGAVPFVWMGQLKRMWSTFAVMAAAATVFAAIVAADVVVVVTGSLPRCSWTEWLLLLLLLTKKW